MGTPLSLSGLPVHTRSRRRSQDTRSPFPHSPGERTEEWGNGNRTAPAYVPADPEGACPSVPLTSGRIASHFAQAEEKGGKVPFDPEGKGLAPAVIPEPAGMTARPKRTRREEVEDVLEDDQARWPDSRKARPPG